MGFFDLILFIVLSINFFFRFPLLDLPIVSANDTLFPGDELTDTSPLISSNGGFTMGFYTIPAPNGINLTYLGIWLTNRKGYRWNTLWIANRDQPIDGDAILTIDPSGTLRVKNRSGATLFNVSDDKSIGAGNKNNTRGKLDDSGNLIVYDIVTNRTIWESFDHPANALFPGMKLGYNHTAKKNWELTSAVNYEVPASGAFTMRLELYQELYQKSPQLVIYRREELYWASGPWNSTTGAFQWLSNFPFSLTYDPSGMYLIVQIIESDVLTFKTNIHLSPFGCFLDFSEEDYCYGNGHGYEDSSDPGCAVSVLPHCRAISSANDAVYHWEFDKNIMIGPHYRIDEDSRISLGDCMERCWKDCGCDACSSYHDNGTGCIYRTNHISDIGGSRVKAFQYFNVLVSYKTKTNPKKSRWLLLSLSIVPILVLAYVMIRIRIIKEMENGRRHDIVQQLTGSNSFNYGDELERGIKDAPDVKIFSLKAILSATNNFSNENKLGQGGYGPVYKGELSDGRKIAIKRLSKTSGQGILEFKSELILISKLQHKNLVRLYGCCIHQEERMLIYEFMPNKSLDLFLYDYGNKAKIDWQIRFKIIEGIAHGLLYLHKFSRMRVIHRDLKLSNVLLDENMNPKISDFGMARIFQHDMSVLITKRVAGTYGYMAPEYVIHGAFSIKSDVFSFGVLILEIVSGKRNSSFNSLLKCAWELWKIEETLKLKDEALDEPFDVNQLLRACHVGLLCVQEYANDRPTMSQVNSMLNNEIADLPIPKQPVFFRHPNEVDISSSIEYLSGNNIQRSVNGLTITTMEAR